MNLQSLIRDVPNWPQPGVVFRDITPLLQNPKAMRYVIDELCKRVEALKPETVVAIESRGFIFGAPVAYRLGVAFVPVRKQGKLPWEKVRAEYSLEYGTSVVEIHQDGVVPEHRTLIVDDLLATGGTASAAVDLVEKVGGKVVGCAFLIELKSLQGRSKLGNYPIISLLQYP